MNKTIELPSGKIIDLNRFVALVPDERSANQEYHLILEGYEQAIALDAQEATSVKEHLKLKSEQNGNDNWDWEKQRGKNQPAIELRYLRKELPETSLWAMKNLSREQNF
jgi:hypothetical protein